jgi:tRNA threonylcarbamoyladenosine biosynthesis protein TsaE
VPQNATIICEKALLARAESHKMAPEMPEPMTAEDTGPTFEVATAEQTKAWGKRLGQALRAGDAIGLVGPLGAGKTTLTQGIAEGTGVGGHRHVASPTFALVNEHPGRVALVHADLYRLNTAAELAELGLDEAFDRAAAVIEWADRFPGALPADHLRITIAMKPDGVRLLHLQAHGPASRRLMATMTA